jgi:hypothetical protein
MVVTICKWMEYMLCIDTKATCFFSADSFKNRLVDSVKDVIIMFWHSF